VDTTVHILQEMRSYEQDIWQNEYRMKDVFNTNILYTIRMCNERRTEPFLTHQQSHAHSEKSPPFVYRLDMLHIVPQCFALTVTHFSEQRYDESFQPWFIAVLTISWLVS
jgi:hypothetical protein